MARGGKGTAVTLDAAKIAALQCPADKSQHFLFDKRVTGLAVRVSSAGSKRFVFSYRLAKKAHRQNLATILDTSTDETIAASLSAARREALVWREQVDAGKDPTSRSAVTSVTSSPSSLAAGTDASTDTSATSPTPRTLGALRDALLAQQRAEGLSVGHQRNTVHAFARILDAFGGAGTPLSSITFEAVNSWYVALSRRHPTTARLALAAFQAGWTLAMNRRAVPSDPGSINPTKGHRRSKLDEAGNQVTRRKGRAFSPEEMATIGATIATLPSNLRAALTIAAIMGLRPSEVCRIRWSDLIAVTVSGGQKVQKWTGLLKLLNAKTGTRDTTTSTRAELIFRELYETRDSNDLDSYVFPSARAADRPIGGDQRTHGLDDPWRRVQAALAEPFVEHGMQPPVSHCYDLRHTWGSTAVEVKISDDNRRLLMGHAVKGADGNYLHCTPKIRPSADKVAERIAARLGLPPLPGRRGSGRSQRAAAAAALGKRRLKG